MIFAGSNLAKQKQDHQNNNDEAETAAAVIASAVKRAAADSTKAAKQCNYENDKYDCPYRHFDVSQCSGVQPATHHKAEMEQKFHPVRSTLTRWPAIAAWNGRCRSGNEYGKWRLDKEMAPFPRPFQSHFVMMMVVPMAAVDSHHTFGMSAVPSTFTAHVASTFIALYLAARCIVLLDGDVSLRLILSD
jgi:hypothetical protein